MQIAYIIFCNDIIKKLKHSIVYLYSVTKHDYTLLTTVHII
jgi:hypothetical protein